jgi:hypothetical protein
MSVYKKISTVSIISFMFFSLFNLVSLYGGTAIGKSLFDDIEGRQEMRFSKQDSAARTQARHLSKAISSARTQDDFERIFSGLIGENAGRYRFDSVWNSMDDAERKKLVNTIFGEARGRNLNIGELEEMAREELDIGSSSRRGISRYSEGGFSEPVKPPARRRRVAGGRGYVPRRASAAVPTQARSFFDAETDHVKSLLPRASEVGKAFFEHLNYGPEEQEDRGSHIIGGHPAMRQANRFLDGLRLSRTKQHFESLVRGLSGREQGVRDYRRFWGSLKPGEKTQLVSTIISKAESRKLEKESVSNLRNIIGSSLGKQYVTGYAGVSVGNQLPWDLVQEVFLGDKSFRKRAILDFGLRDAFQSAVFRASKEGETKKDIKKRRELVKELMVKGGDVEAKYFEKYKFLLNDSGVRREISNSAMRFMAGDTGESRFGRAGSRFSGIKEPFKYRHSRWAAIGDWMKRHKITTFVAGAPLAGAVVGGVIGGVAGLPGGAPGSLAGAWAGAKLGAGAASTGAVVGAKWGAGAVATAGAVSVGKAIKEAVDEDTKWGRRRQIKSEKKHERKIRETPKTVREEVDFENAVAFAKKQAEAKGTTKEEKKDWKKYLPDKYLTEEEMVKYGRTLPALAGVSPMPGAEEIEVPSVEDVKKKETTKKLKEHYGLLLKATSKSSSNPGVARRGYEKILVNVAVLVNKEATLGKSFATELFDFMQLAYNNRTLAPASLKTLLTVVKQKKLDTNENLVSAQQTKVKEWYAFAAL